MGKMVDKLQLPNGLYARILQLLHDIKVEIDSFHPHDTGILRALLYEVLMLLNRAYRTSIPPETGKEPHKDISSFHLSRFFELVGEHFREQHSVQFYADKLCITPNYLNEILSSAMKHQRQAVHTQQGYRRSPASAHLHRPPHFRNSLRTPFLNRLLLCT